MRLLLTLTCSLLACCALPAGALTAPHAAAGSPVSCVEIDLPISIPTSRETIHGQLCRPEGSTPTTVQLLIPGGTYNRLYWDFPYQPGRYSYQRDMARHGLATFAVDRLGIGRSSTPPSAILVNSVEAASIHQVVGHLRAGRVDGVAFERVVLVGHSLGSAVATLEAATYHDVDGVILTGTTHLAAAPEVIRFFTVFSYPVTLDPQRRDDGGDPGYFTTRPGQREPAFYATGGADPEVIAIDETTKDRASLTGIATAAFDLLGPATLGIEVPVLLAVGTKDLFFCGFLARDCSSAEVLRSQETLYFAPAAELSTYVLTESGHAMALHPNADEYREATRDWLRERFDIRDQQ